MPTFLELYFQFIKRLIVSQSDGGVIGLDIGPLICRAVELHNRQDGFELLRWAAEPIEGVDEKSAIAKVMDKLGPASRTMPVVASISGKGTLIRHVDMPRMSSSDLRKAFAMEADKYFPFPKETVYIDCFILDPKSKDKKMSVLVAAVKKDIADSRLKSLKECGIEPAALTVSSIAVANTFAGFPPLTCTRSDLAGHAVAVVDVGESSTNLMIMSEGIPRFTRDIFMGVADVARSFCNMTGVPPTQARQMLGAGAPSGKEAEVQKSVQIVLNNLIAEIKLSFDYFTTEKNLPIARICLAGDGVYLNGFESAFAKHFEIPQVVWNPADMIRVAADRDGFVIEGRRMLTALGLALCEYD